jgi:tyrosine-specific transport protein
VKFLQLPKTLSAALLIGGTCIGGGMLALPVETGLAGFFLSAISMLLTCAFMMSTGFLIIEANLWEKTGAHIFTMASDLLGRAGKYTTLIFYLFISYASLIAYITGGADILFAQLGSTFVSLMLFTLLFGALLYFSASVIGRINAILVFGLFISYFALVFLGLSEVKLKLLKVIHFKPILLTFPLMLTIFSFQTMLPSLSSFLGRNGQRLRRAVFFGLLMAFLIYFIWELIVLGSIPIDGAHGLKEAYLTGQSATTSFRYFLGSKWVVTMADFFAFFAIVTSFLGIGLGLFDFLFDVVKVERNPISKLGILLLILVPSLLCSFYIPNAFILMLDISGGFGDAVLNGIIPILMVFVGRYRKGYTSNNALIQKPMLYCLFAFACLVIGLQVYKLLAS